MNIVTAALVVLVIVLIYLLFRRRETPSEEGKDSAMILLQQQMQAIVGELRGMTREVTSVKEIGRQTQGFAEQLQNLQDILKNPKQRGILGEYYLETVLKNVLPPGMYQMQYPFKNGEIVDAAVFINDKIVPVDSKFCCMCLSFLPLFINIERLMGIILSNTIWAVSSGSKNFSLNLPSLLSKFLALINFSLFLMQKPLVFKEQR